MGANDFLPVFDGARVRRANRGVFHSAARLDVERACLHHAGSGFLRGVALPLPLLLVLVFWAGFLLDAVTAQIIGSHVEISFGSSILLYAVLAGIMHGLRPLFARGRWEVHCIMTGICTSALLLGQYLMLSFRRGSIFFSREVWWQIGGPGLLAMIMAPLVFWALHWLARATAYPYLPRRGLV